MTPPTRGIGISHPVITNAQAQEAVLPGQLLHIARALGGQALYRDYQAFLDCKWRFLSARLARSEKLNAPGLVMHASIRV